MLSWFFFKLTHMKLAGICFKLVLVLGEQRLLTVKMCRSWTHILNLECERLFLFQILNLEPESIFYRPETEGHLLLSHRYRFRHHRLVSLGLSSGSC